MFDILLIFPALRTGRSRTTFYCLAALVFLAGPSKVFAQSDPSNIDVRLFRDINNAQTQFKTSLIGVSDNSVYPILIAAPISLAAYGLAANHNEEFESGVLLGSSEILAYSIGYVLKESVRRERPYETLTDVYTNHLDSTDPYSFPSGHTTGAFALATLLTLRYPKPEAVHPCICVGGISGVRENLFWASLSVRCFSRCIDWCWSSYLIYKCQGKILPIMYKIIGRKESENVSAIVVPNNGGALMNITVRF